MSKGDGLKIGIKFTESLVGNIAEKNINAFIKPVGIFTASNTVSGYPAGNAFDGNPNTFWYNYWGGNAQWIQIKLPSPTLITGFRWNTVSGYRPKDFKLQGSTNGSVWVDVYVGQNPNVNEFQEFTFVSVTYEYYRWTFLNYYNSYIQLSELELRVLVGNESAFTVEGKEYKYVQGLDYNSSLIDKVYKITSVETHPTETKSILLTFDWWEKFNNVVGDLKVVYDSTKGSLAGAGGFIEGFEVSFTPQDLVSTPNPGVTEIVSVAPVEVAANFIPVEYHNRYAEESITVAPIQVTATLINVSEINP